MSQQEDEEGTVSQLDICPYCLSRIQQEAPIQGLLRYCRSHALQAQQRLVEYRTEWGSGSVPVVEAEKEHRQWVERVEALDALIQKSEATNKRTQKPRHANMRRLIATAKQRR